jgi:phosphoserine phosphatase RsbU/P
MRILIVEDESLLANRLAATLGERGYAVDIARDGERGDFLASTEHYDAVILDLGLPRVDGLTLLERWRAGGIGVPVLVLTARGSWSEKVRGIDGGADDYLTKPFQMEELHARVETHLRIRRLQIALEETNLQLEQANRRMSRDLKAAAKIQKTFLPRMAPRIPGTEFAWCYHPCDELAGDALNIIPLGGGKVALYILDVSGHGVSAALLSVTLSRLLSPPADPSSILIEHGDIAERRDVTPPAAVAESLNRLFPFDTATEQFATLLYGILESATGDFRYVAAAHAGPLYLPAGRPPVILESAGYPIGLAEEPYCEKCIHLAPGDRLYLYSDGLPDAMNPAGEPFGDERLLAAIDRARAQPLQAGIATLLEEVARWHGGKQAKDDVSILAVEVSAAASRPAQDGVEPPPPHTP